MVNEIKMYFSRHKPIYVILAAIMIGCGLQYFILSNENMKSVQDALSEESESLIFQSFSVDIIALIALLYYIFCSAASIMKDGVFEKNKSTRKMILHKIYASYLFVFICNGIIVLSTSIIVIILYGFHHDIFYHALLLLIAKSYTAIFYVTWSMFLAVLFKSICLFFPCFLLWRLQKLRFLHFCVNLLFLITLYSII